MSLIVTQEQLDSLEDMMDIIVSEDVRTDYQGRGYSEKTCLAYTGGDVGEFVAFLGFILIGEGATAFDLVQKIVEIGDGRHDSMGRGSIVYWPHISVVSDDGSENDD